MSPELVASDKIPSGLVLDGNILCKFFFADCTDDACGKHWDQSRLHLFLHV